MPAEAPGDFWARPSRLPGLYESERERTRRGTRDSTAYIGNDLDPAEQEQLNDSSPIVIAARAKLALFEAGQPVRCSKPSLREFPAARDIDWLMERGVTEILVNSHDAVRPAPRHPNALS